MRILLGIGLLLTTSFASHSSWAALTDELFGLYEFENNFLDTSGNSNHGVPVNGPGFTGGKIDTGLLLTGTRDYVSLDPFTYPDLDFGDSDQGTDTDFTMSMWIRQDDFANDPAVLSNKDWDSGNNTGINWAPKGNSIFDLNTKGSTGARRDLDTLSTSFPLTVGAWNLVVMSVDRDGTTALYINGVNTGTIPVTSSGTFNGGLPWNIGQDGTGSYGVEFTGAVDELAIWRRALSPSEAGQLWNGGDGIQLGSQVVETKLKLVIDRHTGSMTIENNTPAPQDLIGYQITSAAGALSQSYWTPVSGRLDASGDGSIDADDNWIVGTHPDSVSDFIELSLGNGTLETGNRIELGPATWSKFYAEGGDISFQYADGQRDELITGTVEFVGGPNGAFPFDFGDLDFDGDLDSDDWLKLQRGFAVNAQDFSEAQRYRTADLDIDGLHTLDDILLFRQSYEELNGVGSFQAMVANVPEPSTLALLAALPLLLVCKRRAPFLPVLLLLLCNIFCENCAQAAELFSEDFNSIALGPKVDESVPGSSVWSSTPPSGWTIDNTGVPSGGVTEWRGWTFADPAWWAEAAENQQRSEFSKGTEVVAVADPDEWDDLPRDPGFYNTFLTTPSISLAGVSANTVELRFDSSWRPEDSQTAEVRVSFDGGAESTLLRWTSSSSDSNFKADATNETVAIPVNNPASASTMTLEFGMTNAGNDWWWAIDNVLVFAPLTLQVDVQTGEMQILGDPSVALTGYEILSPGNSLAPAGWQLGNLSSQGLGNPLPAAADFNENQIVDGQDLSNWEMAYGTSAAADADADGDSDGVDFFQWQRQAGFTSDPTSTWLPFLATKQRLVESYLLSSTTIASDTSLGLSYDVGTDRRDLEFTYLTAANEKLSGVVQYVNVPGGIQAVPEASTLLLALVLSVSGLAVGSRRRSLS